MGLSGGFLVDMHPKRSTFAGIFAGMESFRKFVGYLSKYSIWSMISLMVLRFRGSFAVS